ncbi:MAG TPA: tyrosine--tRNA ligase [Candidatus Eisenbacteria bacterium]|nr:tyrosine--tRNA ligase [Candidatus Eisenbacteria bacterium]
MNNVYDTLVDRGYFAQATHPEEIREHLAKPGAVFYIGFDPTADSLHIGHLTQMMVMAHMQRAGHIPIALMGGGTGWIGDPSGRSDMRQLMTEETINHNVGKFKEQMERLIDFSDSNAIMANNADWLLNINYVEFLRDIGVHFSVNKMLSTDIYKNRLEDGLTYFEFSYMLLQAYDFLELYRRFDCHLQMGGRDQWANIIAGADLIRRVEQVNAYGMTFNLLETASGEKMGKTAQGALWLDADKLNPFEFYQYFRNLEDASVIKTMKILTFLPLDEIAKYEKLQGQEINKAKEVLAYEVTKIVHGEDQAQAAQKQAQQLFSGAGRSDEMPTIELAKEMAFSTPILDILNDNKMVASKSEGRRLIKQGGVYLNDQAISDLNLKLDENDFENKEAIIRRGKKNFFRIILK